MKKIFTLLSLIVLTISAANAQVALYVNPVTGNDGTGAGTSGAPWRTLSRAMTSASPGNGDTIYIAPGTITADGASNFGITLDKYVVIIGSGPGNTIIEGDTTVGIANRGILFIPSSSPYCVRIKNLTLRNGKRAGEGGAIYYEGSGPLYLENLSIIGNQGGRGGAISHQTGKLFIKDCYFASNSGTYGGAIYRGDDVHATDSLVVENTTFYQNYSGYAGGACFLERGYGNVSVFTNCTFYQNSTQYYGGAVRLQDGNTNTFINCTVANNVVNAANYASAGGIDKQGGVTCNLQNCIIANNTGRQGFADLIGGGNFNSLGNNLIGNLAGEGFTSNTGDLLNINAGLDLANYGMNGGAVPTIPLLSCSQAMNAGNPSGAPVYPANQINRFGNIDMGAYEYPSAHVFPSMVIGITGDTLVCYQSETNAGLVYSFPRSLQDPNNTSYTWGTSTGGITITSNPQDSVAIINLLQTLSTGNEVFYVVSHDACGQASPVSTFNILKPEITLMMGDTKPSCFGGSNGAVNVSAFGSAGPYTYLWGGGQTTNSFNGQSAGTYSVTVTDAYGCYTSDSRILSQPPQLVINFTSSNIACFVDTCVGQISTTIAGGGGGGGARTNGAPSFSYMWNTGANTSFLDSLCEGTYTLTVTEIGPGCVATDSVTITRAPQMFANLVVSQINCFGWNNGQIDAFPTGGTGAYYYNWMPNGQTVSTIISLSPGQYNVYITDGNGCVIADSATMIEPTALSYSPVLNNLLCNGDSSGNIALHVYGGTLPYTYTWNNGATTDSIGGLSGGTYTVSVTDAYSCGLGPNTYTLIEPAVLSVSLTSNNVTCYSLCDGNAQAITSGGTQRVMASGNYLYSWSNGDLSNITDSLCAGTYSLTITDQNGCTLNTAVVITEPAALTNTLTVTPPSCYGSANGQITSNVTGGTGTITYNWLNTSDTTSSIDSLPANNYFVNIMDANGCALSDSAYVIEPPDLVTSTTKTDVACNASNGSIGTNVSGGTMPYSYIWNDSSTAGNIVGLSVGNYSVVIADVNGCADTLTESIVSLGSNPVLMGTATIAGTPITGGVVEIYELTGSGVYTLYSATNIDSVGKYTASVLVGQYLILAKADINTYPGSKPTYYGNTFRWDLATASSATCDSVLIRDVAIINLPVLNGIATISGSVIDITVGKTTQQGDPIPGVDVSLEQNPGSVMLAQTQTDSSGYYQFTNVPVGTGYTIHVDIPGLPLVSTYTIDVTPSTTSINNNFYVDSTSYIDTVPPIISGIKHYVTNVAKSILKTYPNPFKNSATVEIGLTERSKVYIEVYNVIGAKIEVLENTTKEKGLYTYSFGNNNDGYSAGVYFVKTTINGAATTLRIVKSE